MENKMLQKILSHTKEDNECLIWTRCFNTDGYARMSWKGNVNGKVHRIVYELNSGQDISGYVVRHTCDNIKCINPKHLILGTNLDNIQDRVIRNRSYRKITKEIIAVVLEMLKKKHKHQDIARLVGIDPRRVSDINCGKYDLDGHLTYR